MRGFDEIAELLITYSQNDFKEEVLYTNINCFSPAGATPLFLATENGHLNVIKVLLKYGALPSLPLKENTDSHQKLQAEAGDMPLHVAVKQGRQDIVEILLTAKEINPNAKTNQGKTALELAVIREKKNILEILLTHPKIDISSSYLLHEAAARNAVEIIKFLIDKGLDVNSLLSSGATPLFLAVERGHLQATKALLEAGALPSLPLQEQHSYHPKLRIKPGDTPLHVAIKTQRENLVEILLQSPKINIRAKTDEGINSLELAKKFSNENIIKMLQDQFAKKQSTTPTTSNISYISKQLALFFKQENPAEKTTSSLTPS